MYGRFEYYGAPDIDQEMAEARQYTHIFQVPQDNRKEMERFLKQKQGELKVLEKRVAGAKEAIRMRAKELRRRPEDWQLTNRKLRDEYERVQLAIQMAQGSLSRMKEGSGLDIRRELELQEARRRYPAATYGGRPLPKGGRDPKEGAGEFYRMVFKDGTGAYFYRTGTLKNGNAKGYRVDVDPGRKPRPPKQDSVYRETLGVEWKKISEKDVPPAVMARFKGVMESVELDEFRLLPRKKGDLHGAKKGQTITFKANANAGGGEKKLTVARSTKAKGYGTIIIAKDQKGREYHLPLNSKGQATVVLRRTGDPNDPNESEGSQERPVAWFNESLAETRGPEEMKPRMPGFGGIARSGKLRRISAKGRGWDVGISSAEKKQYKKTRTRKMRQQGIEGLGEACGKKHGKKKGRKEEIEAELGRLESTSSPFPEVRARRIEELRAELEEAKGGGPQWKKAAEKLLNKSLQSGGKGQEAFHYRAYLRAVVSGTPSGHLAQKFPGAERAKQDLIDLAGRM